MKADSITKTNKEILAVFQGKQRQLMNKTCEENIVETDDGLLVQREDKTREEPSIKMWLDDMRPEPDGWTRARDYNEAVALLSTGRVSECSLDHDLSDFQLRPVEELSNIINSEKTNGSNTPELSMQERTGKHVVLWMIANGVWPEKIAVHSANPVGKDNMQKLIKQYRGAPPQGI